MLAPVFRRAKILGAHAHRFRHTLATDILARGGTMADVADVLGISEHAARKHYAKWPPPETNRDDHAVGARWRDGSGIAAAARANPHRDSIVQMLCIHSAVGSVRLAAA